MLPFALRFDLRNPAFAGVSSSERLCAALDMVQWGEERGCVAVSLSEHHGSHDGYLPSPIVFGAAVAGRTKRVRIGIAALIAPLYDPVRLAEDLAVLDALSKGRVDIILGAGYVAEEFALFGVPMSERAARVEETVAFLRRAWSGEPFERNGRTVRVTPTPHRPGGPPIVLGGSSDAAARRAARIADGYLPSGSDETWQAYRDELVRLGKPDPGPRRMPGAPRVTMLARDVEAGWERFMPYFLHETNAYAAWLEGNGMRGPYRTMTGPEELRASGLYRVVTPEDLTAELQQMGAGAFAMLNPMAGGVPPAMAWECLELFEKEVLPNFAAPATG